MYTLDAKTNINHCHLAILSYNSVVIFFTYLTKTASYLTLIILNFRNFSLLLSDDLLSGYTPQLDVQNHPCHPMQSVGDL